jgi:hypothetical protein
MIATTTMKECLGVAKRQYTSKHKWPRVISNDAIRTKRPTKMNARTGIFWGLSKMIPQPGVFDVIIVGNARLAHSASHHVTRPF